jgi:hypothetical protein
MEETFDREHYFYLLGIDPREAATYVDAFRYGTDDPVGLISGVVNKTYEQRQLDVTNAFLNDHPDFPVGQEAAAAMAEKVRELTAAGMPYNETLMDYAYWKLQSEGVIEPKRRESRRSAEPATGEPTEVQLQEEAKAAEQMSDDDLQKLLEDKGMFKAGISGMMFDK